MKFFRAFIGFILIFIYHIPRLLLQFLQISYSFVFNKHENLTADPKEHLKRANDLLKKKKNSLLLYAALEIRFAAERMIDNQLAFAEKVSKKTLKKYDPVKKRKAMTVIDPNSDNPQKILLLDRETGEKILWGIYKPIELEKLKEIRNKLGDLLHPKVGLKLGNSNDPWYIETRRFLKESAEYLSDKLANNEYYFAYKNLNNFELIKLEH